MTSTANQSEWLTDECVSDVCPYLGTLADQQTYSAVADVDNYCHHAQPPEIVDWSYQQHHCMCVRHLYCPVYAASWQGALPDHICGIQRPAQKVGRWWRIFVLFLVVCTMSFFANRSLVLAKSSALAVPSPVPTAVNLVVEPQNGAGQ